MKLMKWHDPDLGLLLVRLGLAAVFITHGWAKVDNIPATAKFFSSLGLDIFWVHVVAWVELLGGVAMLTGVLSRWAGLLLTVNMAMAIYLVKWSKGWGSYEFELVLLLGAFAIYLSGPGKHVFPKKLKV